MALGRLSIVLAAFLVACCSGHSVDKTLHRERESDGAYPARGEGHSAGATHSSDFDHESILGSSKDAEEFDHLPPEESKRRLEVLLEKMDVNRDKFIDTREMQAWILRSFEMLSREESEERFEDADEDGDEQVTWAEHISETYGISDPSRSNDFLPADPAQRADTTRMMEEDRQLFDESDLNKDGFLTQEEFLAFSHPEESERMVPLLVRHAMAEKDKDKDGKLSFAEYIKGLGTAEEHDDASLLAEKERFDEDYDTNGDGELDQVEVRHWLVPDNKEVARTETEHLFAASDADEDGVLSFDEVLIQHQLFVGSEVTDYGDHLHNLHRFTEEL